MVNMQTGKSLAPQRCWYNLNSSYDSLQKWSRRHHPQQQMFALKLPASLSALDSNRCLISLCGLWLPRAGVMHCQDSWGRRVKKRAGKGGGGGCISLFIHTHQRPGRLRLDEKSEGWRAKRFLSRRAIHWRMRSKRSSFELVGSVAQGHFWKQLLYQTQTWNCSLHLPVLISSLNADLIQLNHSISFHPLPPSSTTIYSSIFCL